MTVKRLETRAPSIRESDCSTGVDTIRSVFYVYPFSSLIYRCIDGKKDDIKWKIELNTMAETRVHERVDECAIVEHFADDLI